MQSSFLFLFVSTILNACGAKSIHFPVFFLFFITKVFFMIEICALFAKTEFLFKYNLPNQ